MLEEAFFQDAASQEVEVFVQVGAGQADKSQVAFMIKRLLPAAGEVKADAADALAVAITHAHHRRSLSLNASLRGAA